MQIQNLQFKRDYFSLGPIQAEFESSGLYFIQGANGSGKTSLLRILQKRLPASSGRILNRPKPIAFLGSENFFFEDLSIVENFKFLESMGIPLAQNFDRSALEQIKERQFSQLSEGQAQRARLQLLLSFNFPCYLLDEAFAHLDVSEKIKMQTEITERSSESLFILSIHESSEKFGSPKGLISL